MTAAYSRTWAADSISRRQSSLTRYRRHSSRRAGR